MLLSQRSEKSCSRTSQIFLPNLSVIKDVPLHSTSRVRISFPSCLHTNRTLSIVPSEINLYSFIRCSFPLSSNARSIRFFLSDLVNPLHFFFSSPSPFLLWSSRTLVTAESTLNLLSFPRQSISSPHRSHLSICSQAQGATERPPYISYDHLISLD
jgi:hypothetical protein